VIIMQLVKEVGKVKDEGPLAGILGGMLKWMEATTSIQEITASVMLDEIEKNSRKVSMKGNGRQAHGGGGGGGSGPHDEAGVRMEYVEEDPRKRGFAQAVKDAEKATLIFNTDMGRVPIMNTQTMNRKFSLALKDMAAVAEGNVNGEPRFDTVTQLDDTLSMVKHMDFFGKTTRKVKDKEFFTVPVKLTYKDRDTRIAAETNLRKLCKVSCTVPYHSTLRDEMRKVVDRLKDKYNGCWVQARPDAENMCLRISYREGEVWRNDVETVPLPDSVLDTSHKVSIRRPAVSQMDVGGVGENLQG